MYILYPTYVLRIADSACIPLDQQNSDYQKYLEWVDAGNTATPSETNAQILLKTKSLKKQAIREAYELDCESNIQYEDMLFQGGFDSAIKLDAAMRLASAAGLLEVTFWDSTNNPRVFTITNALNVVLAVAQDYQIKLARKQVAMVAVESAKSLTKVNSIQY